MKWLSVKGWCAAILLMWSAMAQAEVRFSSSGSTVLESDGTITLTVLRSGTGVGAASVRVLMTNGSATPGADFSGGEGTLSWADGDTSPKTLSVTLVMDSLIETDETAHFALTDVTGESLGSPSTFALVIRNVNASVGADPGLDKQQKALGSTVDNLCPQNPPPGAVVPPACRTLKTLTDTEQKQALDDILPRHVSQQTADVSLAQTGASRAVGQRMQSVRVGGGTGGFQGDVSLIQGDQVIPLAVAFEGLQGATRGGSAGGDLLDQRWGFFATGQLSMADQNTAGERVGYVSHGQQVTMGMDYRFSSQWFAGSALSISTSSADLNGKTGSQNGDVVLLMGFASHYLTDSWYVDGSVSAGQASYHTTRVVRLGADRAEITSSSTGSPWSAGLGTGLDLSSGALSYGGYARVDHSHITIGAYDEKGGDGLALSLGDQSSDSTQSTVGVQATYVISASEAVWTPKATIEWLHQFSDGNQFVQAAFANHPEAGTFEFESGRQDQDYFNAGWSLAGTFTEGRSAYVRYEALVGRANYIAELIEVGGRIAF